MLVSKAVELQKDFEETWALRGDEVDVALAAEVGLEDVFAWASSNQRRIPIYVLFGQRILKQTMHKSFAKPKEKDLRCTLASPNRMRRKKCSRRGHV